MPKPTAPGTITRLTILFAAILVTAYVRAGEPAPAVPDHTHTSIGDAEPSSWFLAGGYTAEPIVEFAFDVEAAGIEMLACELRDVTGKTISVNDLLVQPGPNRLAIPIGSLAAGAYTLSVSGADLTETVCFIKTAAASSEMHSLVRGR